MKKQEELIEALGNIVTVWAHPDDETYLTGGLMAMARQSGAQVTCVVATDGDFAESAADRRAAGRLRVKELHRALDALDVQDRELLHLPDGGCTGIDNDWATETIGRILESRRPDTIITFGPDGLTGHADHRAVSRWTTTAARCAAPASRVLHPTLTPELAVADRDITDRYPIFDEGLPATHDRASLAVELQLDGRWLDTKMRALECHRSQTRALIHSIGPARYRRWVAAEPFVDATS